MIVEGKLSDYEMITDIRERLEKIESALFYIAGAIHRFDILTDAGFELIINGEPYRKEREV